MRKRILEKVETIEIMMDSLEDLVEEFRDLETPEERIQYLIELGGSMPELSSEYCTEEYRVVGCQSMVWFVPHWDGTHFTFEASSDAPMVRGLAAILVSAFSGKTPQAILEFPIETIFQDLHLKSFLSPLRSNGLNSMIKRVREIALEKMLGGSARPSTAAVPSSQAKERKPAIAEQVDSLRGDFPILARKSDSGVPVAYLDNAASSQRPASVIDAISIVYREHYSNVHRSGHEWAGTTTEKMEASREAVRRYIDAPGVEEVIFTSGTTASINLIAQSWGRSRLSEGDEILLSEMEHHANIVPWLQLASQCGVKIRWIPIDEDFHIDMDAYKALLSPKVKLVSITAVSNVLGTVNPVQQIVREAKQFGAKVMVDAAQAVPHGPLSVQGWGADWGVFSGHKMLASSGVGVLWGRREILESMPAWQGGGNMIKLVTKEGFTEAGLPHKFEAGTPAIAEIVSFKPAIEYLEKLGGDALREHECILADRAIKGLKEIPGVDIYSPSRGERAGIVSFNLAKVHGDSVARFLDSRGIAIRVGHHCAMPLHQRLGIAVSCRASFYLYNTVEEVDRLVSAVHDAASLFR
ncbi:putative cysteine desulfurase [Pirellula sp. SH-Sr6A]|uniref:SufS family cysteine desulfurase n=1 Tax=Pirellula sp. SH-Sr6A TaxID=1632865 RepID=UPI00078EF775|nr:SufS family cysteine desulfurase [Pirellula sp. SH-Sr6A]AMV35780.1 putative cysteine desulfurase [Pirellula sp. SH-Sr6A]